ncbi:unnamed protein product [Pleuronectes platessa]|uniref:Protein phosphatase 1 regulatory subunit 27 n=1 Tax=Pleuronectes platessa TaxID=8262 RepID=A0A9N7Z0R3_PLEPL|nr:unnamed protein product [Pleuronectes platessa]
MKFNYHVPASTYTRASQYTPTYHTPTTYTPVTIHTDAVQILIHVHDKEPRYRSTRRPQAQEPPAPVAPVTPAKRTVHFPNDIIFQDIVRRGDLEQIGRFMRARKVRVDTIFHSGMAALHEAVLTGNMEVVKLLVKYGADVHQRDEDGWTPLHMACSDGYPEIARYLLSIGASTEAENENGEKPADLIDPDCKELARLFETGCV